MSEHEQRDPQEREPEEQPEEEGQPEQAEESASDEGAGEAAFADDPVTAFDLLDHAEQARRLRIQWEEGADPDHAILLFRTVPEDPLGHSLGELFPEIPSIDATGDAWADADLAAGALGWGAWGPRVLLLPESHRWTVIVDTGELYVAVTRSVPDPVPALRHLTEILVDEVVRRGNRVVEARRAAQEAGAVAAGVAEASSDEDGEAEAEGRESGAAAGADEDRDGGVDGSG